MHVINNIFKVRSLTLLISKIRSFSRMASVCREVSSMTDSEVSNWFDSFDTVMTDCDGVLWVGAEPISGSPDIIQRLRQLGKRVFYVTNNSTKHRREYKTKVDKLGFGGELEEIIGTAYLAAAYLEEVGFDKSKLVYVVGSTGITQELDDVGIKYLPIGPDTVSLKMEWEGEAKEVAVGGEFNGWVPVPLACQQGSTWAVNLDIEPGCYAYRLLVDGVWKIRRRRRRR